MSDKKDRNSILEEKEEALIDSSKIVHDESSSNDQTIIDTVEIIVVQCANGYEYAMHNTDFNPVIENELDKSENIKVKAFPYKTLMGVSYQGVFDRLYCTPIIERVDVDFLILTRFNNRNDELNSAEILWGYELKIVNTETSEQIKSINAHDLKDYKDIEKHIKDNIEKLKADIEKIK